MTSARRPGLAVRISAALGRPLFGTRVIPRDARVDPALFPDDEFPIFCRACEYDLRGLPDGPCPECGTPFERGRELVLSYVYYPLGRMWWHTGSGRWLIRFVVLGIIAIGLELGSSAPYWFLLWRSGRTGAPPPRHGTEIAIGVKMAVYALEIVAFAAVLCCLLAIYRDFRRIAAKRRRIIAAIPPGQADSAGGADATSSP